MGLVYLRAGIHEGATVLETLNIQRDARALGSPLNHSNIGEVNVGHVADRNEFVEPDSASEGGGIDGDEQRARLGDERGFSASGKYGAKEAFNPELERECARYRPKNTRAVGVCCGDNFLFKIFLPNLAKARGDDDEAFDAFLATFLYCFQGDACGDGNYSGVDCAGHVHNRGVDLQTKDLAAFGIDRVDLALEPLVLRSFKTV